MKVPFHPKRAVILGMTCATLAGLAGCADIGETAGYSSGQDDSSAIEQAQIESQTASSTTTSNELIPSLDVTESSVDDNVRANTATMDFTYKNSDATYDEANAAKIDLAQQGDVDITDAGTYVISGATSDGQVTVSAPDDADVTIVLDDVDMTCADGPCICIDSADHVTITLADGSNNTLSDGTSWAPADGEPDATIYSKSDVQINGSGTITINGTAGHGVHSADDLVITGSTLNITAANDGLKGKDRVMIAAGDITIDAGDKGIVSDNDADADRGLVSIDGGTISITAADAGIKASRLVRIADGTTTINAANDGINSDLDVLVNDGQATITAGNDGVHAEYDTWINSGTLRIEDSVEAIEGQDVLVSGGDTYGVFSDDGINASSADTTTTADTTENASQQPAMDDAQPSAAPEASADSSQQPAAPDNQNQMEAASEPPSGQAQQPNDAMGSDTGATLTITDGTLELVGTRQGDTLDANGSITITGGTILGSGASSGDSSVLDYETSATISGGTFVSLGSSMMLEPFSSDSAQPALYATISGSTGDTVSITDANGTEIVSYTAKANFNFALISTDDLTAGESYTVSTSTGQSVTTLPQ